VEKDDFWSKLNLVVVHLVEFLYFFFFFFSDIFKYVKDSYVRGNGVVVIKACM
jgi:hypothetical protein